MHFLLPKIPNIFLALTALIALAAVHPCQAQTQEQAQQEKTEQEQVSKVPAASPEKKAAGLEPMVVTATRVETPLSQVTKSLSVVTGEQRDAQQEYFIPKLLDNEPGVLMRRLGGPGQWSEISIRGAPGQFTQFQYNGMPLRDMADTQSTLQYFIEDLYSGSNLRQVEILKGTQSTLYGSQAIGGVINIIPEKWKRGTGGEVRSEFGEHSTFIEHGRFYHGQDKFFLDFNPMYITMDGMKNGGKDGFWYENTGFTAGTGYRLSPDLTLEFSSIFFDTDLALSQNSPSLDAAGNLVGNTADPIKHRKSLIAQYGLGMDHAVSSCWNYSVKGAYTDTRRHYFWSAANGDQSNYDGTSVYLETQHNIRITDWLSYLVGVDFERSDYDGREPNNPGLGDFSPVLYKEKWFVYDLFNQASFKLLDESLFLNFGGRFNDHEAFDSKFVGEASAAYLFKKSGTKVHSHIGSGYRTPSLYEIYGGYVFNGSLITIGNPDLRPEESLGYEFGVEQAILGQKAKVGLTWFHTDFDDLIAYDGLLNKYINADKARAEGVETYLNVKPWKWLNLSFAYTYTDSKVKDGDEWVRRSYLPRNKVSSTVTVSFPCDLTTSLRVGWQDQKIVPLYDPGFNSVKWKEPSVVTVDAAATYTFLKKYQTFVRVENLFDESYTESGYLMPGRTISGGLKLTF